MESENPISLKSSHGSDSGFSTSTSLPRSPESFSLFGDGSCGEPLSAQHLVVDFTPLESVDNDYVQRKCCAFWDFISSQPGLQALMAMPESDVYRKNFEKSDSTPSDDVFTPDSIPHQRTAVSMLEIVEEKGLIDRTFEAKLAQSHCTLGSREYHENEIQVLAKASPITTMCSCSGICKTCSGRSHKDASMACATPSSPVTVNLCKKMQEWDSKHPKCMDPPGHPPALSHCGMQRKMVS